MYTEYKAFAETNSDYCREEDSTDVSTNVPKVKGPNTAISTNEYEKSDERICRNILGSIFSAVA